MSPDHHPPRRNKGKADGAPQKSGVKPAPPRQIEIQVTGEVHHNVYGSITKGMSTEEFVYGMGLMFGARVRNLPNKEKEKAFSDFLQTARFYSSRP